ncbi:MAG: ATP-binding protein [Kiritimatiellia bacterium]
MYPKINKKRNSLSMVFLRLHRQRSLRATVLFYVVAPMCVVMAAGAWWGLRTFEQLVEQQMQRDLEMVAEAIKGPLSHALLREREGSIAEALKAAFDLSEVYGAFLYDAEGRRISSTEQDKGELQRADVTELAAAGKPQGEYSGTSGQEVYSHVMPLTDSTGQITGLLQLTRRRSDFVTNIGRLRTRVLLYTLLGFVGLSGLVMMGHHLAFGRHLHGLTDSMNQIARGNRGHRHRPNGARELRSLGEHFNRMLDNIDEVEIEIRARRESERSLEGRLRHAEKMAAIGELAAGVAHELGTPLSMIDARVQKLLRAGGGEDGNRKAYTSIRTESARMQHIIRQLLDFSRRNPSRACWVDCGQLLRDAVAAVKADAEESRTRVEIDEPPSGTRVRGDPVRLEQALVNLLRNAIQAAPGGEVRCAQGVEGGNCWFQVEDDGAGMDPDIVSKIFEPFFTTKSVGEGTGLGLAVVHGIATEHGGRIELDADRDRGSCFRLVLPNQDPQGEHS